MKLKSQKYLITKRTKIAFILIAISAFVAVIETLLIYIYFPQNFIGSFTFLIPYALLIVCIVLFIKLKNGLFSFAVLGAIFYLLPRTLNPLSRNFYLVVLGNNNIGRFIAWLDFYNSAFLIIPFVLFLLDFIKYYWKANRIGNDEWLNKKDDEWNKYRKESEIKD